MSASRPKPRGRRQLQRWYDDHAQPGERPFVGVLPNGKLGKLDGRVLVAETRDNLTAALHIAGVPQSTIAAVQLEIREFAEGTPIIRAEELIERRRTAGRPPKQHP